MSRPDEIVFEDLHGVNEDEAVTVDLDASTKGDGISRTPADQAADDDAGNDDDIQLDGLRSADTDDEESSVADAKTDDKDDASKASEDDGYSKKVKARITREQRAKRKERERADYWQNQAKKLAKDGYERDKKDFERTIERTDSDIEQVQADLEKAIEDGQTKDQVRLTNRLTDLKADKARAEFSLNDLSEDGNLPTFDDKVSPTTSKTEAPADKWMEDRSDWYGVKGFERQTRMARLIDQEVYKDGYDPESPEYFEELDKRIKAKAPELYEDIDTLADGKDDNDDNDKEDKTSRRGKSIVAGVDGQGKANRQRANSSKVELTTEDFDTMRQFNLDPNDPEVLKEFARNKREAEGAR
jgi:hypothetical protein